MTGRYSDQITSLTVRRSNTVTGKRFVFLSKRPERFWGPFRLLLNGYARFFPGFVNLTAQIRLVPRLGISGAIPLLSYFLLRLTKEKRKLFTFISTDSLVRGIIQEENSALVVIYCMFVDRGNDLLGGLIKRNVAVLNDKAQLHDHSTALDLPVLRATHNATRYHAT